MTTLKIYEPQKDEYKKDDRKINKKKPRVQIHVLPELKFVSFLIYIQI